MSTSETQALHLSQSDLISSNYSIQRAIAEDSDLTAAEAAVIGALTIFRNGITAKCNPSLQRIADASKWGLTSVKKALRTLRKKGWLSTTRTGKSSLYFISMEKVLALLQSRKERYASEEKARKEATQKKITAGLEKASCKDQEKEIQSSQSQTTNTSSSATCTQVGGKSPAAASLGSPSEATLPIPTQRRVLEDKRAEIEPLIPLPDEMPDDWRKKARKLRPEVQSPEVYRKLKTYMEINQPGLLLTWRNWRNRFLTWVGREKIYPANREQPRTPREDGGMVYNEFGGE